ncbi:AAA family ATPase [Longispora albida]|uniref:AAA family ATPase n=1 Tax=Longispora albida TaxID=203523 RepID=UPI00058DA59E|nr:LuxR family transcriptional regulator [Longispora albida]
MSVESGLLGREETLGRCRTHLRGPGGVLLYGPAGIGKSTLVDTLAAEAARSGQLVLRSTPSAAEAELPYLALFDLFGAQLAAPDLPLPPHLRAALETALLRSAPRTGEATGPLAIRIAVVELLRALADRQPVLLVLDDVHWLDPASGGVLAFAARRLDGRPVRVLAAERITAGDEPFSAELMPAPRLEVGLDGLPEILLGELLRSRLDMALPTETLSRVRAASGGNPLYALELGRALRRRGEPVGPDDPLPVPERLRQLVADRLAALPDPAMSTLLLIAAAARPAPALLPASDPGLAIALDAGVLLAEPGGDWRFSHPLLGELVYADATPEQRRAAHAALAQAVDDPVEQVRHRALATASPDAGLAEALARAARVAAARGAPATAAELARLAAGHTPGEPEVASARLLDAAEYAYAGGLPDQARSNCAAALRAPSPRVRVGARLLLVEMAGLDRAGVDEHLAAAESDAQGDLPLSVRVRLRRAEEEIIAGGASSGLAALDELGSLVGADEDLRLSAAALRVPLELQRDPARAEAILAGASDLAEGRPLTKASVFLRLSWAVVQLRRGEVEAATRIQERLRADVERAGRIYDLCDVLYILASIYDRAGRSAEACAVGTLGGRLSEEVEHPQGPATLMLGSAELNGGTVERAVGLLDDAIAQAARARNPEPLAYALGLRGRAEILLRRPSGAVRELERARRILHGLGYTDPTTILIDADLAENLALTGAQAEAGRVITETLSEVDRLGRDVARLGLARAAAMLAGITGDARAAADRLRAEIPAEHPYPLEIARAHLSLAALERRARRRAAARTSLQEALSRFAHAGNQPWQEYTRVELSRLDTEGPLTDVELRIAELVRAGATNREIAGILHLSVKAVEANLTRLFRRLGVRNRAELISRAPNG